MLKKIQRPLLKLITLFSLSYILTIQANTDVANTLQTLSDADVKHMTALKNEVLSSTLSYQLIESLTTEVGPRMMGTPGDELAIKWAVAKMNSLGFDKVWTEEITNSQWIRGKAEAKIIAPYPQKMVVLALGGSIGTNEQGISANIVHFKTLAHLKAAKTGS